MCVCLCLRVRCRRWGRRWAATGRAPLAAGCIHRQIGGVCACCTAQRAALHRQCCSAVENDRGRVGTPCCCCLPYPASRRQRPSAVAALARARAAAAAPQPTLTPPPRCPTATTLATCPRAAAPPPATLGGCVIVAQQPGAVVPFDAPVRHRPRPHEPQRASAAVCVHVSTRWLQAQGCTPCTRGRVFA